jgi:hypothetical protein
MVPADGFKVFAFPMAPGRFREFFFSRRHMERITMLRFCGSEKKYKNPETQTAYIHWAAM